MSDKYVLEWSRKENAFQIQKAKNMVESNLNKMLNNYQTDYVVLCIADEDECHRQAKRFRDYLRRRKDTRHKR